MGTTSCMDHIAEKNGVVLFIIYELTGILRTSCFAGVFPEKIKKIDILVEAIHFQKSKTNNT